LPQWDRTVWTNEAARATWEPRLRRIVTAWGQVERASVAEGVRGACLQSALPEGLAALGSHLQARSQGQHGAVSV